MLLMSLSFSDVWTTIVGVLYTIFLMINSFIYDLINFTYQIFLALASAQIFTADQYQTMAQKVYVVIGVVALFFVAYALLRAIADPEGSSKGDMAVGKVVPNLLKAIILIAFTPTIFNIAYNLQNVIIMNNVIPALVVGNSFTSSNVSTINGGTFDLKSAGNNLANDSFTQFLTTASGSDKSSVTLEGECKIGTCLNKDDNSEISYNDMFLSVQDESKGFIVYANLGEAAAKGDLDYNFLMQFAVGLFMVYVFVSFCIDMGVRIFKLAYYQIIAPIPILTLIIPGQKKIFDNWKKGSISTFAEVFIRLAIVMFGMVLIQSLPDFTSDFWSNAMINPSPAVSNFARIFIIIGVLMFIKQAPKLISDMFGIKSGSFKLGIGDKLREGGVFAAAGAVGAGVGAIANKTIGNTQKFKSDWAAAKGKKGWESIAAHAGVIAKGAGRFTNPAQLLRYGSAGLHGYNATKNAKSFADFNKGMNSGVAEGLSSASIPNKIKQTASDFAETARSMATNQYTPVSGELAKYQKRIEAAQAVDVRKKVRDLARANDLNTITANRNLTNFDSGSYELKDAGKLLRSTSMSQLNSALGKYNADYTKKIAEFKVSGKAEDYDAAMKQLDNINHVQNIINGTETEADRNMIHTQFDDLRSLAEKDYINKQAAMSGSEINMEINTANRLMRDNSSDAIMKNVKELDPTKVDIYDTLKDNHNTIANDNDPNSNINKLRADPNYINALEADRKNKEYKANAEKK